MSLLSIVVPTRNRQELLAGCLDSLLTTTVPVEILVSNNASTDGTAAMLDAYAERDARVRVIHQPADLGIIGNANFLFGAARGDYMCLFTDDDVALPGCFEPKVALLDNHPDIDLVYSLWYRLNDEGQNQGIVKWPGLLDHSYVGGRDEFLDLLVASYICPQSAIYRRELFDLHGGFDPALTATGDWDMLLRYLHGRKTAFLHVPTCAVRFHASSYTESVSRRQGLAPLNKLRTWEKWLVEREEPLVLQQVTWQRMAESLASDTAWCYDNDRAQIEAHLAKLTQLRLRNQQRCEQRALDAIQLPPAPPAPRFPLEGAAGVTFLLMPQWRSAGWRQALSGYLQAFRPGEPVTLVLWLDPQQGLELEAVAAMVEEVMQPLPPGPDLLLVPEALSDEGLASLVASCNVLVTAGDDRAAALAAGSGKRTLDTLTREAWRRRAGLPA